MSGVTNAAAKIKKLRGANWSRDSLKSLLDVAIVKRPVIRGSNTTAERKQQAWADIADAVSAVGVPRTPQECENKLRCYTSEVKNKFAELERQTYQSGGGGGTPFKEQRPTETEELALAYLGIGFVGGRNTPLDAPPDYDYVMERRRELRRGQNLQNQFDAVVGRAKRTRAANGMATTSDDDEEAMAVPRRRKAKTQTAAALLGRIQAAQEDITDRIIRIEEKLDGIVAANGAAAAANGAAAAANGAAAAANGADIEVNAAENQDVGDEPGAPAELPIENEPEPPKVHATCAEIKDAFESYCTTTSDPEWGRLLIASLRNDEMKKIREKIFLAAIEALTDDEIDELQAHNQEQVPIYIRATLTNECQYRLQSIIITDLVAGRHIRCNMDDEMGEAALECSVHVLDDLDTNLPTISETLRELYNQEGLMTAEDDNQLNANTANQNPQPSTSSSDPTPSTSTATPNTSTANPTPRPSTSGVNQEPRPSTSSAAPMQPVSNEGEEVNRAATVADESENTSDHAGTENSRNVPAKSVTKQKRTKRFRAPRK